MTEIHLDWLVAGLQCDCDDANDDDDYLGEHAGLEIINPNAGPAALKRYTDLAGANVHKAIGRDYLTLVEQIARECAAAGGPVPADEEHVTVYDNVTRHPRIATEVIDLLETAAGIERIY